MKWLSYLTVFIFLSFKAKTQSVNESAIDRYILTVDAKTPAALSKKLTEPFQTDAEKVRAIFRWITENIGYNTIVYQKPSRSLSGRSVFFEADDTSSLLPTLNEHVAQLVMQRRVAVCDGYARLFKILCDHAGIRSEIIYGYARTNYLRSGKRFLSNHTWNAVYINNAWHLLDATWASGYVTFGNAYIKHYNEAYYLAPPQQFIEDHYPEFIYWSLLPSPPTLREFQYSPLKSQAYIKYRIQSFKPASGIIEAAVGDTLEFELETGEKVEKYFISANPYFEVGILPQISTMPYRSAPFIREGNKIRYRYVLSSSQTKQLHVVLNDRVILQYKVQVKNNLAIH